MIFNIDKPRDITSFGVVKLVKKITKMKKVGHGGTLDPFATGVLVIGTEKDTKRLSNITTSDKDYIAELKLGETTSTLDTESEVRSKIEVPNLSRNQIDNVLNDFKGDYNQIPPMFSAKKKNGVRLYKLARNNISIDRDPVLVKINDIKLVSFKEDILSFFVSCSKGTYIRVLGEDIAKKLDTIGYLINLRRTRVGEFNVEDSLTIENFEENWKLLEN